MANIKLGELLLKANLLQESQLRSALMEQKQWGGRLGEILVRMSLVTEEVMVKALSTQLNIPAVNLDAMTSVPPDARAALPIAAAHQFSAVPLQLRDEGRSLVVAMAEPQNMSQVDAIRALCKCKVQPYLAGKSAIQRALNRFYGSEDVGEAEGPFVINQNVYYEPNETPPSPRNAAIGEDRDELALLESLEEIQRKQVGALKAMVDLLVEKRVFSREEYSARIKR